MSDEVNDDMLMAFVDGELDASSTEAVRRALAGDAALAAKAEALRRSRDLARQAFAIREEPVPEHLARAVRQAAAVGASDRRKGERRWPSFASLFSFTPMQALPVAAGLVLALGLGFLVGRAGPEAPADLLGTGPLAQALAETPGGEARDVRLAGEAVRLSSLATYPVADGLCRSFEVAAPDGAFTGVGCERGSGWRVDLAVSTGGGAGYAPASGGALSAVDAYLDSLEAEPALPAGQ